MLFTTPRYRLTPSAQDVEEATDALTKYINATNEEVFKKHRPFHPEGSPLGGTRPVTQQSTTYVTPPTMTHGKLPMADSRIR